MQDNDKDKSGQESCDEIVEIRQYTAETEDEIGLWIVDHTKHEVSVVIVGETLYIGDQKAEYGDEIIRSAENKFTVRSQMM